METQELIAVTGATGQLGRLVVAELLKSRDPSRIVAAVRDPDKAKDLAAAGVAVRAADYDRPETLAEAFAGVGKLLLISSSEVGRRVAQHQAAIAAAKAAGVGLIVYTSVLRADVSPLGLAEEHRQTEAALAGSGVPHVLLRNGWYTENYSVSAPVAVQLGLFLGSAGEGLIASASRQDFAEAAAAVLTSGEPQAGRIYELAGDQAYTLADFAAAVAEISGNPVAYRDLPEQDYKAALLGFGLPEPVAGLIADSDVAASKGALFDDGRSLGRLIGRPTTPWRDTIAAALKG
ncbi:SDR family oxidoreductase [Methylopila sp. M107]|uniref:SDR family oxidoreductase n=1 Tax=Methylopila sp. M107 TaxID=1101190 RepID=UPI00035D8E5D|nr:SDR family oxidoreductase [Methylopila sp. M107]